MSRMEDPLKTENRKNPELKFKPLPTFITKRLILRAVTVRDILSYQKYFVDYEVIQHLSAQVPWPYPENGVREFLEKFIFPDQGKKQWLWGIFEKDNPKDLIGSVHLWREGRPEHRGFWLGKAFWGMGYMTEAVAPVMDYAFHSLGFEKLCFANAVGNVQSRRIKEKTGAKMIDVKPAKFVSPAYTKHEIWELKKEEWESRFSDYCVLNSEKNDIQVDAVHAMLTNAYWCRGIPYDTLRTAIDYSLCFGIYEKKKQIGFVRVISDSATFAWLCDVIIEEGHRGQGLAEELIDLVITHPNLKGLRRICLATKDAHKLYEKFGFKATETPQNWMEIKDNEIYLRQTPRG